MKTKSNLIIIILIFFHFHYFFFQLWPENPTYQVYVPGYHTALPNVSSVGNSTNNNNNHRARSVSPEEAAISTITSDHPRANSRGGHHLQHQGGQNGQGILYAELQFPVTSNYGSMKKRSQRDRVHHQGVPGIPTGHAPGGISQEPGSVSGNTTATTSVNSGEPSPTMMASMHEGLGSMDSVHRYVPDYVAVSTRKTAV